MTETINKLFSDMSIDMDVDIDGITIDLESIDMNDNNEEDEVEVVEEVEVEDEVVEDIAYKIAMNELLDDQYVYSDEDEEDDEVFFKKSLTDIKKELEKHRKFSAVFCIGMTKKKVRCSRKRQNNKKYCKMHQPKY